MNFCPAIGDVKLGWKKDFTRFDMAAFGDVANLRKDVIQPPKGRTMAAGLLWKALYDAGIYVNVMIPPAVPLGGALLRCSVMATR